MKILAWIPSIAKDLDLNDREIVFCWLIYTLHSKRGKGKDVNGNDVYHMANSDFQNILGITAFTGNLNLKLEKLRRVFRIAQCGGYWSIQFSDECMKHNETITKKICAREWTYIKDSDAIGFFFYLQGRMVSEDLLTDWYEGQDMNEFYRDSVLPRSLYTIMKLRRDLYENGQES